MLDPTNYLSSFGWQGKGTGLRDGSVSRPLAIPQKRTLAGLGKDRDEAFPFWDHLFTAAAKSIQIKVSGDDEAGENDAVTPAQVTLLRTTTGILSNRRPVIGTPASSGTTTPSDIDSRYLAPRLSLVATAKRESARKRLYSGFFRGPVLGPDAEAQDDNSAVSAEDVTKTVNTTQQTYPDRERKKRKEKKHRPNDSEAARKAEESKKKKKHKKGDTMATTEDGEPARKRKRESLEDREEEEKEEHEDEGTLKTLHLQTEHVETAEERRQRKAAKAERRKRKEERRKAKAERRHTAAKAASHH